MDHDLNVPKALGRLFALVRQVNRLLNNGELDADQVQAGARLPAPGQSDPGGDRLRSRNRSDAQVERLIDARHRAREAAGFRPGRRPPGRAAVPGRAAHRQPRRHPLETVPLASRPGCAVPLHPAHELFQEQQAAGAAERQAQRQQQRILRQRTERAHASCSRCRRSSAAAARLAEPRSSPVAPTAVASCIRKRSRMVSRALRASNRSTTPQNTAAARFNRTSANSARGSPSCRSRAAGTRSSGRRACTAAKMSG